MGLTLHYHFKKPSQGSEGLSPGRTREFGVKMAVEIFPAYLLDKDKWDEAVIFIQTRPVNPRRKKELIVMWAQWVGAVLTREMVEQVLGDQAGSV